ncbi:hypothetical protein ACOQNP_14095 [Ectopseudomonas khazarica]|uniref:hypothetical protein n=1 Tax=Ectopseudomonas khazarica TaxID=2502979 RepID=UPI003B95EBBB
MKLQLEGFMLTKLVEFAGGQDDWGGQEEDGYVAGDEPPRRGEEDWGQQESQEGQADDDVDF